MRAITLFLFASLTVGLLAGCGSSHHSSSYILTHAQGESASAVK